MSPVVIDAQAQAKLQLPRTFTPTHDTGNLAGFPAIDEFAPAGTQVLPPEAGKLVYRHFIAWDLSKRVGGWTVYLQSDTGDTYFLTHFGSLTTAARIERGTVMGTVAAVPNNWWQSHIHEGKHVGIYNPNGGAAPDPRQPPDPAPGPTVKPISVPAGKPGTRAPRALNNLVRVITRDAPNQLHIASRARKRMLRLRK